MGVVERYLKSYQEEDTLQPSLFQKEDGTVWLRNPDMTETQLGAPYVDITAAEFVAAGDDGVVIAVSGGGAIIPFAWAFVASDDWVTPTNGGIPTLASGGFSDSEAVTAGKWSAYALQPGGSKDVGDLTVAIPSTGDPIEGGSGTLRVSVSYVRLAVPA